MALETLREKGGQDRILLFRAVAKELFRSGERFLHRVVVPLLLLLLLLLQWLLRELLSRGSKRLNPCCCCRLLLHSQRILHRCRRLWIRHGGQHRWIMCRQRCEQRPELLVSQTHTVNEGGSEWERRGRLYCQRGREWERRVKRTFLPS